jgi:hypothetical protein
VSHTTNWRPDPYGVHEFRFFSADGKPTLLVMDGGKTSYDKPPSVERSAISEPQSPALEQPSIEDAAPSPVSESGPPRLAPTPQSARLETVEIQIDHSVTPGDSLGTIVHTPEEPLGHEGARPVPKVVVVPPTATTAHRERDPIARPLKIAFGIVFGLLAVSALGFLIVHFPHSTKGTPQRAVGPTSTTTLAHDTTTTTVALPTALKPSAEAAAEALVSDWSTGNRLAALSVATPAAATTLFAVPYASGLAIDRGCSTAFTPIVCTFGPPGGASPTDPIYEIRVNQSSGGWYVSSVKIEN